MYPEHTGLNVKDMERSLKFYQEIMELKIICKLTGESVMGGEITLAYLGVNNTPQIELIYRPGQTKEVKMGNKLSHIGFIVDSLDDKVKELKNKGIRFELKPTTPEYDVGVNQIAMIKDTEGVIIELLEKE